MTYIPRIPTSQTTLVCATLLMSLFYIFAFSSTTKLAEPTHMRAGQSNTSSILPTDRRINEINIEIEKENVKDTETQKDTVKDPEVQKDNVKGRHIQKESVKDIGTQKDIVKDSETQKEKGKETKTQRENAKETETQEENVKDIDTLKENIKDTEMQKENGKDKDTHKENVKDTEIQKDNVKDTETPKDTVMDPETQKENLKETEPQKENVKVRETPKEILVDTETQNKNLENMDIIVKYITKADILKSDYMKIPKLTFLPNFKNPCFNILWDKENVTKCLPYFMIGGFPKTGTTDLYGRLNRHPHILGPAKVKEPLWWSICRYNPLHNSLNHYAELIGKVPNIVKSTENKNGTIYHPTIVGDYSTREMLMEISPWVDGATTPHMIHHLVPTMKFIVLMREPIARLYSDYLYFSENYVEQVSPENFHIAVTRAVEWWTECTSNYTLRDCLYGPGPPSLKPIFTGAPFHACWKPFLKDNICGYFRIGFYYYVLKEWMQVFPRNQFLFLRSEDFVRDPAGMIYDKILPFLDVNRNLVQTNTFSGALKNSNSNRVKAQLQRNGKYRQMLNTTRVLLSELYREPTKQLVQLLEDERFLWKDIVDDYI